MKRFEKIGLTLMNRTRGSADFHGDPIASVLGDPYKRALAAQILGQAYVIAYNFDLGEQGGGRAGSGEARRPTRALRRRAARPARRPEPARGRRSTTRRTRRGRRCDGTPEPDPDSERRARSPRQVPATARSWTRSRRVLSAGVAAQQPRRAGPRVPPTGSASCSSTSALRSSPAARSGRSSSSSRGRHAKPKPPWSTLRPDGTSDGRVLQIADRVPKGYRLDNGSPLVLAHASPPSISAPIDGRRSICRSRQITLLPATRHRLCREQPPDLALRGRARCPVKLRCRARPSCGGRRSSWRSTRSSTPTRSSRSRSLCRPPLLRPRSSSRRGRPQARARRAAREVSCRETAQNRPYPDGGAAGSIRPPARASTTSTSVRSPGAARRGPDPAVVVRVLLSSDLDPRLVRAKARLDRLDWYPRPVRIERVRVLETPWLFRLPWFRRFDGYALHGTILLRSRTRGTISSCTSSATSGSCSTARSPCRSATSSPATGATRSSVRRAPPSTERGPA